MTNEEAAKLIKVHRQSRVLRMRKNAHAAEAVRIGYEAVKCRIPMKVIYTGFNDSDDVKCRICGYIFGKAHRKQYFEKYYKYCSECGQALDWRI